VAQLYDGYMMMMMMMMMMTDTKASEEYIEYSCTPKIQNVDIY
jgi:hypothetical protein